MKKIEHWDYRIHILFALVAIIAIVGFQPGHWLSAGIVSSPFEVYKVEFQQKKQLTANKWTEYEISKALQSVTSMKVSGQNQLPSSYLLFKFEQPLTLDASPIAFPIHELIVTLPKQKQVPPYMLLKNPNGQWIRYETAHPLTILTNDYE